MAGLLSTVDHQGLGLWLEAERPVWHIDEAVQSNTNTIGPDSFVTISYQLFEEGKPEPIDLGSAEPGTDPEDRFVCRMSYIHGYGFMVPALEKGLTGAVAPSKVSISAKPVEAFGLFEQDGILEIEKDGLEGASELQKGDEVLAVGPEGDMIMRVLEVRDESIVVDTNHPLAGKHVRFEVDIIDVRAATEEEIEEAQAEIEDMNDACGCGEPHEHGADHDHDHEGHDHEHGHTHGETENLVQLGIGKTKAGAGDDKKA